MAKKGKQVIAKPAGKPDGKPGRGRVRKSAGPVELAHAAAGADAAGGEQDREDESSVDLDSLLAPSEGNDEDSSDEGGDGSGAAAGTLGADPAQADVRCDACGASPKDVDWFEFQRVVQNGALVSVPSGTRCSTHGKVHQAWPLMPWDGFCRMMKTSAEFKAIVQEAELRLNGKDDDLSELPDCGVDSMQRQGLRIIAGFLVYSLDAFTLEFKHPPDALGARVTEIVNEFGDLESVVLLFDDKSPRRAELFSDVSINLRERAMMQHLRPGQAKDTFDHLVKMAGESRVFAQANAKQKWVRYSDMKAKAAAEQARKEEREAAEGAAAAVAVDAAASSDAGGVIRGPSWMVQAQQQAANAQSSNKKKSSKGAVANGGVRPQKPAAVAAPVVPTAPGRTSPAAKGVKRDLEPAEPLLSSGASVASVSAGAAVSAAAGAVDLSVGGIKKARTQGSSVAGGSVAGSALRAAPSVASVAAAVPAAGGAASYFDISKILLGQLKGQTIAGAQKHLKTLTGPSNARRRSSLQAEITVAESALRLSPDRIELLDLQGIQKHMQVILRNHAPGCPLVTRSVHLKKFIDSCVQLCDFSSTFAAIRPWSLPDDEPNPTKPYLHELLGEVAGASDDDESTLHIKSALQDGFFGNGLCTMICSQPDGETRTDSPQKTLTFCRGMLGAFEAQRGDADLGSVPDFCIDGFDEILSFCRAVIAYVSPVPNDMGASLTDATAVFDPDVKTTLSPGLLTAATSVATDPVWQSIGAVFWDHYEASQDVVDPFRETVEQWEGICSSEPSVSEEVLATVRHTVDELPAWLEKLRPGAAQQLAAHVVTWSSSVVGLDGATEEALKLVIELSRLLDPDAANTPFQEHVAKAKAALVAADQSAACDALLQAVSNWSSTESSVDDLLLQLERTKGTTLQEQTIQAIRELRTFLQKAVAGLSIIQIEAGLFDKLKRALLLVDSFKAVRAVDVTEKWDTDGSRKLFLRLADLSMNVLIRKHTYDGAVSAGQNVDTRKGLYMDYLAAAGDFVKAVQANKESKVPLVFWAQTLVSSTMDRLSADSEWRATAAAGLVKELSAVLEPQIQKLSEVNGGTQTKGTSWKEGLDLASASTAEIRRVADGTLMKCYSEAIASRQAALLKTLAALRSIAAAESRSGVDEALVAQATSAAALGSTTLFEGRVMQGLKYAPLARRKHMVQHLGEYKKALQLIFPGVEADTLVHEHAHAKILAFCNEGSEESKK